jgi:uncharacterized circularly permuted ATP-grasp superfamily protein
MADPFFNEMYGAEGLRRPYQRLEGWYQNMPSEFRALKQAEAEDLFRRYGITFAVYGEGGDPDRLIPFDMFPRVFAAEEWRKLERGIKQRARALNAFLSDVYDRGEMIRAGRIPADLVYRNEAYEIAVAGFRPPLGFSAISLGLIWCARGQTSFMCWKITAARLRACPTCWKTAK